MPDKQEITREEFNLLQEEVKIRKARVQSLKDELKVIASNRKTQLDAEKLQKEQNKKLKERNESIVKSTVQQKIHTWGLKKSNELKKEEVELQLKKKHEDNVTRNEVKKISKEKIKLLKQGKLQEAQQIRLTENQMKFYEEVLQKHTKREQKIVDKKETKEQIRQEKLLNKGTFGMLGSILGGKIKETITDILPGFEMISGIVGKVRGMKEEQASIAKQRIDDAKATVTPNNDSAKPTSPTSKSGGQVTTDDGGSIEGNFSELIATNKEGFEGIQNTLIGVDTKQAGRAEMSRRDAGRKIGKTKKGGDVDVPKEEKEGFFKNLFSGKGVKGILKKVGIGLGGVLLVGGITSLVAGLKSNLSGGLTGILKMAGKWGVKGGAKLLGKTALGKVGAKIAGKALGKTALKKIPILGALISIPFAIKRIKGGDIFGGILELASGVASIFPGVGTGISIALDSILAFKDLFFAKNSPIKDSKAYKSVNKGFDKMKGGAVKGAKAVGSAISKGAKAYMGALLAIPSTFKKLAGDDKLGALNELVGHLMIVAPGIGFPLKAGMLYIKAVAGFAKKGVKGIKGLLGFGKKDISSAVDTSSIDNIKTEEQTDKKPVTKITPKTTTRPITSKPKKRVTVQANEEQTDKEPVTKITPKTTTRPIVTRPKASVTVQPNQEQMQALLNARETQRKQRNLEFSKQLLKDKLSNGKISQRQYDKEISKLEGQTYHSGGIVQSYHSGGEVNATLKTGEFVLDNKSTDTFMKAAQKLEALEGDSGLMAKMLATMQMLNQGMNINNRTLDNISKQALGNTVVSSNGGESKSTTPMQVKAVYPSSRPTR